MFATELQLRTRLVGGFPLACAEAGAGERVCLLVHGTGCCSRVWVRTVGPLAGRFRVIAPDLPGFGRSPRMRGGVSFERYAAVIDALAEQPAARPVHLIGHSMGGLVALAAAARNPSRYERLVLVGSTATSLLALARSPFEALRAHPRVAAPLVLELLTGLLPPPPGTAWALARSPRLRRALLGFAVAKPKNLPPDAVEAVVAGAGRPGFVPAVLAHRRFDLGQLLPAITLPTLGLAGDRDRLVPLQDARAFVADVPAATLTVVRGAGHLPMLEEPEQVAAALGAFLTD